MTKILGSTWFTPALPAGGPKGIGIVLVEDTMGEHRAYIGIGNGINQRADEIVIARWGATFPVDLAKKLI